MFTRAVAGKTAASQTSFPLNSAKISQFSSLKGFNLVYTLWILFFYAKLNDQLTHSDHRQSHL